MIHNILLNIRHIWRHIMDTCEVGVRHQFHGDDTAEAEIYCKECGEVLTTMRHDGGLTGEQKAEFMAMVAAINEGNQ